MIVNAVKEGWKIIFQRNHALLAGALALQIQAKYRPPNWAETLSAILEHDDGQVKWRDKEHITASGQPLDFSMQEFDAEQATNVVMDAIYKSRWVALLTSMHTTSLYAHLEEQNAKAAQYIEEQKKLQFKLRKALGVDAEEMETHYRFMRWCDECSLILCQSRLAEYQQRLEVGRLGHDPPNFIFRKGRTVKVDPWCFEADTFEVFAEYQIIKQLHFNSTSEFKNCLDIALRERQTWTFVN